MLLDGGVEQLTGPPSQHRSPHFAFPFQHPHHHGLPKEPLIPLEGDPLIDVHVAGGSPDLGLIDLDFAHQLAIKRTLLQRQPNPMHHEPGGFLGDAEAAGDLIGTHPVLGVNNHPNGTEPLIELDGAVLEDRPDFDTVLFPAGLTFPHRASLEEPRFAGPTAWASRPLRPAQGHDEIEAALWISKVVHRILKIFGEWLVHGVLREGDQRIPQDTLLRQVYYSYIVHPL